MKQQNDGSDTKSPELTRKPFGSQNVMHLQKKTNTVKKVTRCKKIQRHLTIKNFGKTPKAIISNIEKVISPQYKKALERSCDRNVSMDDKMTRAQETLNLN